jgi:hypothetical protein
MRFRSYACNTTCCWRAADMVSNPESCRCAAPSPAIARQDACNTLGRGTAYRTACRSLDPQEQRRVGSFRLLAVAANSALPHGHAVHQRPPAAFRRGVVAVRVVMAVEVRLRHAWNCAAGRRDLQAMALPVAPAASARPTASYSCLGAAAPSRHLCLPLLSLL